MEWPLRQYAVTCACWCLSHRGQAQVDKAEIQIKYCTTVASCEPHFVCTRPPSARTKFRPVLINKTKQNKFTWSIWILIWLSVIMATVKAFVYGSAQYIKLPYRCDIAFPTHTHREQLWVYCLAQGPFNMWPRRSQWSRHRPDGLQMCKILSRQTNVSFWSLKNKWIDRHASLTAVQCVLLGLFDFIFSI